MAEFQGGRLVQRPSDSAEVLSKKRVPLSAPFRVPVGVLLIRVPRQQVRRILCSQPPVGKVFACTLGRHSCVFGAEEGLTYQYFQRLERANPVKASIAMLGSSNSRSDPPGLI